MQAFWMCPTRPQALHCVRLKRQVSRRWSVPPHDRHCLGLSPYDVVFACGGAGSASKGRGFGGGGGRFGGGLRGCCCWKVVGWLRRKRSLAGDEYLGRGGSTVATAAACNVASCWDSCSFRSLISSVREAMDVSLSALYASAMRAYVSVSSTVWGSLSITYFLSAGRSPWTMRSVIALSDFSSCRPRRTTSCAYVIAVSPACCARRPNWSNLTQRRDLCGKNLSLKACWSVPKVFFCSDESVSYQIDASSLKKSGKVFAVCSGDQFLRSAYILNLLIHIVASSFSLPLKGSGQREFGTVMSFERLDRPLVTMGDVLGVVFDDEGGS